jgi:hypothetical protein
MPAGPSQQGFCRAGNRASIVDALFILLSFSISFGMFSPTSSYICSQVSKMESAAFFPALKRYPR